MTASITDITRFAPSPTGRLHLGHAYSALFAASRGARFLLRIEDIDLTRCKPEFEQGIYEDLGWLGLEWEAPVRRQSEHFADYAQALATLQEMGLLYPCFCSRKEIQESATAPHGTPQGPEGALYPGTCRNLSESERAAKIAQGLPYAFRLDMGKALAAVKGPLYWVERGIGRQMAAPAILGDVVLARKDVMASYHLSVTLDDDLQGVTLVTRGEDLLYATHLHRLLQELLQLNVPEWQHHKLLLDHEGKRFAKRNLSVTLQHLREVEKKTPAEIMDMAGLRL